VKLQILVVAFVLAGCGGESFRGFSSAPDTDGGPGGAPTEVDAGGNGGAVDSDSGSGGASGGTQGSGGAPTSTGGAPVTTGGSSSGGASTGGTPGSGGEKGVEVCCQFPLTSGTTYSACDAAEPWDCVGAQTFSCMQPGQCTVGMTCYKTAGPFGGSVVEAHFTHDNGNQQTWKDCVPPGTYNEEQAMKACKASGAATCVTSTRCGPTMYEVQGLDAGDYVTSEWGYGGSVVGMVSLDYDLCGSGDPGRRQWR
jgi:hypothetical protein